MLFGYSSVTFVSDTIVRVSLRCHFPVCMFLRFGKAGWDCVTKGNIFICTHYFFLFLSISLSRREQLQRYVSQNLILGILYSLSIFETLYVFY